MNLPEKIYKYRTFVKKKYVEDIKKKSDYI